jgi:rhodanese-related sulfurtransferase
LDFDSVRAAQQLMEMGFPQVMVLKGGYGAWKKAGYPLEPKKFQK